MDNENESAKKAFSVKINFSMLPMVIGFCQSKFAEHIILTRACNSRHFTSEF